MYSRIMSLTLLLILPVTLVALPTTGNTEPLGCVHIPASKHIKNTGGSDGAGLCVFTSMEVMGNGQGEEALDGFQKYMTHYPGGGWPEKVDEMFPRYCKSKGIKTPPYFQHTGGDEELMELIIKTGRPVCMTYGGYDDFYKRYVAHMVNGVFFDKTSGVIIDNNRPGKWVSMTHKEYADRWKMGGGGWLIALLNSPLPPFPPGVKATDCECDCGSGGLCNCGPGCRCKDKPEEWTPEDFEPYDNTVMQLEGKFYEKGDDGVWREVKTGVDPKQVSQESTYRLCIDGGVYDLNREQAFQFISDMQGGAFKDDSDKWFLTVVSDDPTLEDQIRAKIPLALQDKLHIKILSSKNPTQLWYIDGVLKDKLVRIQKPIRDGAIVVYEATDINWDLILQEILKNLDPNYNKPLPPIPNTPNTPNDPNTPTPTPWTTLAAAAVGLILLIYRGWKNK